MKAGDENARPVVDDIFGQLKKGKKFSSDRTIKEYCDDIWMVKPVRIQ